jgi:AraC-like DNA-binding protein
MKTSGLASSAWPSCLQRGGIRPDWVSAVVREMQVIAASALPDASPIDSPARLGALIAERIPRPETALERYVLGGLVAEAERHLAAAAATRARDGGSSAARRAARLLADRFAERWTLDRLAHEVGCNRFRLCVDFQREFGATVRRYLTALRVREAERLLAETNEKIEAIASSVGYRGKKAFYDAFKRRTGASPLTVRQRARALAISA